MKLRSLATELLPGATARSEIEDHEIPSTKRRVDERADRSRVGGTVKAIRCRSARGFATFRVTLLTHAVDHPPPAVDRGGSALRRNYHNLWIISSVARVNRAGRQCISLQRPLNYYDLLTVYRDDHSRAETEDVYAGPAYLLREKLGQDDERETNDEKTEDTLPDVLLPMMNDETGSSSGLFRFRALPRRSRIDGSDGRAIER